jgi:hypothetical protein
MTQVCRMPASDYSREKVFLIRQGMISNDNHHRNDETNVAAS